MSRLLKRRFCYGCTNHRNHYILVMFALIISDKIERHIVTLCCACATLIVVFGICLRSIPAVMETLNVKTIFTLDFWYHTGTASEATSGINWATILFIAGMMVMVEGWPTTDFSDGCAL